MEVGAIGLAEVLDQVAALGPLPEERLAEELLSRFKARNYVPKAAEKEYAAALLQKFKESRPQAGGKEKAKGGRKVIIKVLGPGCKKCQATAETVKEALAELNVAATLEKVEDPGQIVSHGVMMTPGVVINGKVKVAGRVPKKEEVKKWIEEELKAAPSPEALETGDHH